MRSLRKWLFYCISLTLFSNSLFSIEKRVDIYNSEIIEIGNPILRQKANFLQKEEILSPFIQGLILHMRTIMYKEDGAGLAAPQIGYPLQMLVLEIPFEYIASLSKEKLVKNQIEEVPFQVIFNPKLTIEKEETVDLFEGCLSIPELVGVVARASSVKVEGLDEKGEPLTIYASGFHARILQHEIDHLNGVLCIDHAKTNTLTTFKNYDKFYKNLN